MSLTSDRNDPRLTHSCVVESCGKPRARANGLCQMHNWRLSVHGDVNYVPYPTRTCQVTGCAGRHKGHGYCQMHLRRHRNGLPLAAILRQPAARRYRIVKRPDHPLAMKNGRVAVHRMVLYDMTGGCALACFWCARPLFWHLSRDDPSAMYVDHLNHDRHDNTPTNLVPSCNSCNAGRMAGSSAGRVPQYAAEAA